MDTTDESSAEDLESRTIPAWKTRMNIMTLEEAKYEHYENLTAVRNIANELLPFLFMVNGHKGAYRENMDISKFHTNLLSDIDWLSKRWGDSLRKYVARELHDELTKMCHAHPSAVNEQLMSTFKKHHHNRVEVSCNAGNITPVESIIYHEAGTDSIGMMLGAYRDVEKKEEKTAYDIEKDWRSRGIFAGIFGTFVGGPFLGLSMGSILYALGSRGTGSEYQGRITEEFRKRFSSAEAGYVKRLLDARIILEDQQ